MGCKYSRFRVPSKREKWPPGVETAAGKRQTRQMSDHVTISAVRGKKYAVLNLSNSSFARDCKNVMSLPFNLNSKSGKFSVFSHKVITQN